MTPVSLAAARAMRSREVALGPFTMPDRIETERLVMTRPVPDDVDGTLLLYANPQTARFIGGPCDQAVAYERFATMLGHWVLRGFGFYTLTERDGPYLGICGIWFPEGWHEIEVAYALLPEARGKGFMTEAIGAVRAAAFAAGAPSLVSYIEPRNLPSQAVARRVGAQLDGHVMLPRVLTMVFRHPGPDGAP